MEANSAKLKFKSSVNLYFAIFFALFQIVVALLLSSIIYTTSEVGFKFGVVLGIIDILAFVPMFFRLRYEIHDAYLYVCDWPFGAYKIPYKDIISINEEIPKEQKHVVKVGLSTNRISLVYTKHKKGGKKTVYMLISPADKESFLMFLNTKIKSYKKFHPEEKLLEKAEKVQPKATKVETKKEDKVEKTQKAKSKENKKSTLQKEKKDTPKKQKETEKSAKKTSVKAKPKQKEEVQEETVDVVSNAQAYFTVEDDEKKPK